MPPENHITILERFAVLQRNVQITALLPQLDQFETLPSGFPLPTDPVVHGFVSGNSRGKIASGLDPKPILSLAHLPAHPAQRNV